MEQRIQELIERLERNNISAVYVSDKKAAFETVMGMIPEHSTVGFGDSLTLRQIGVVEALEKGDYTFLNPWKPGTTVEENVQLKRRALVPDVFVTGTNALTLDGKLVNVDGHGNRVAAMLFGPDEVIRHSEFSPSPPCAETGSCCDCDSPWRICNKTVIIERQYDNDRYKRVLSVVIVGEELGL
jgi:hypothetical protein